MPSLSKIILIGHVGQDPRTPSQANPEFITFSLAVTDKWKDKSSGERKEHTEWYECITSKSTISSVVKNYVKKGDALYIEGTPKFSTYQTKSGETKVKISVDITLLKMINSKEQSGSSSVQVQSNDVKQSSDLNDYLDDELPF
ncbi:MAG: single-stranded DNA-binding protein [Bacteroidetes bacterium]|nr:single-stranded DNA-binding protein [Bacteroidota bacterium]